MVSTGVRGKSDQSVLHTESRSVCQSVPSLVLTTIIDHIGSILWEELVRSLVARLLK